MDKVVENERNVLACILLNNKYLDKCKTTIQLHDFVDGTNKLIFNAMLINDDKNMANDYTTILATANQRGYDIDVMYLIDMTDALPTAENIDTYLAQMREYSNKRQLREVMEEIIISDNMDSESISNKLKDTMDRLTVIDNTEITNINEGLKEYINVIADGNVDDIYKTLYTKLDSRVKIKPSQLIAIGARTSVGKSAYALNLIINFLQQGLKVLYISLEMSKEEITDRMLSYFTGIDQDLINGRTELTPKQKTMLYGAVKMFDKFKLEIHDRGNMEIDQLHNLCSKMKQANKIDILVVDHISLIKTKKYSGNKTQELGYISNRLKEIAMSLKIPIIALTQLNRNVVDSATGKTREPTMSDIRQSGDIEQDCNTILLLHAEDGSEEYDERELLLKIAKNRSGKRGSIIMNFKSNIMKIRETTAGMILPLENEIEKVEDNVFE